MTSTCIYICIYSLLLWFKPDKLTPKWNKKALHFCQTVSSWVSLYFFMLLIKKLCFMLSLFDFCLIIDIFLLFMEHFTGISTPVELQIVIQCFQFSLGKHQSFPLADHMTFLVYSNSFPSVPEGTVKHATDNATDKLPYFIECQIL